MHTASSSPHPDVQTLYAAHQAWLVRWLRQRLGDGAEAADLAHDTWLRILGKPQSLDGVREPRAWLTTVAHGLMTDRVRRRDVEQAYLQALASLPAPSAPSPEQRLLLLDALARIDALLDGLPVRAREAFLLSRLDGLSYPEIAARLKISLSSVEKDMACAIRHCYLARLELGPHD